MYIFFIMREFSPWTLNSYHSNKRISMEGFIRQQRWSTARSRREVSAIFNRSTHSTETSRITKLEQFGDTLYNPENEQEWMPGEILNRHSTRVFVRKILIRSKCQISQIPSSEDSRLVLLWSKDACGSSIPSTPTPKPKKDILYIYCKKRRNLSQWTSYG